METKKRAQWGSKIGFLLAYAGSAVGLGNIWKFPGKAYEGGGAAFIIIYIACVALIGWPLMVSELTIGRAGKANAFGVFQKLDKRFSWVGAMSILTPFVITCYYTQVGGYVLRYIFAYVTEPGAVYARPLYYFYEVLGFTAETGETFFPLVTILFAAIFLIANAWVIIRGVSAGIEKINKVAMPLLFFILIALLVKSLTLPGAGEGLAYMLKPDWSKVSFDTFLSALGQAFYSLSLGMGITITYGSYLVDRANMPKSAAIVCSMDTLVALLAGFMIVPACFATLGAERIGKGASFAFASLAGVFEAMPGGRFVAILFYLLLFFAALTSSMSLTETIIAYAEEYRGWSRKKAAIILSVLFFVIGIVYTCSQVAYPIKGIWADFANGIMFPCFGDAMEWLCDRLFIPVTALGCAIFAGWVWKPEAVILECRKTDRPFKSAKVYAALIRWFVPLAIILILGASLIFGVSLG